MPRAKVGVALAFLSSVPLDGEGCVLWPYARTSAGYGHLVIDGRPTLASRISCERRNGPAPSMKHQAAHSCGRGHDGCCAPWHLSWKTPAENCADTIAHGTRYQGQSHHWSKLTAADVTEIRRLAGTVRQSEIGAMFGVTQSNVSQILRGKSWCAEQGVPVTAPERVA
jgi:hypothetical protein